MTHKMCEMKNEMYEITNLMCEMRKEIYEMEK